MQKETAVRAIIIGIVVIGGIILAIVSYLFFTKPDPRFIIHIDYGQASRSLVLGPEPGGVWASPPHDQKLMWHTFELSITNNCDKKIHINPSHFRLSFSKSNEFDPANVYLPTLEGIEFQTRRLESIILNPGETIEGTLTFKVKDRLEDESDGQYGIIQYADTFDCDVKYTGQNLDPFYSR